MIERLSFDNVSKIEGYTSIMKIIFEGLHSRLCCQKIYYDIIFKVFYIDLIQPFTL